MALQLRPAASEEEAGLEDSGAKFHYLIGLTAAQMTSGPGRLVGRSTLGRLVGRSTLWWARERLSLHHGRGPRCELSGVSGDWNSNSDFG